MAPKFFVSGTRCLLWLTVKLHFPENEICKGIEGEAEQIRERTF